MTLRKRYKMRAAKPASTFKMEAILAPVTIQAAAEGEEAAAPTFSALAYSGGVVPRGTARPRLDHDYIIDLSGMTQSRSPKANLDHKASQRVGHLTSFENDGKQLSVSGALSAATPHRDEVANSATAGFGWEVSIEGDLAKPRKLAAGKTEVVNGREVKGPLFIFGKSVLTGIAFVSQGADDGNSVTIAASAADKGEPMNEFEKWLASLGLDHAEMEDDHKAELQLAFEAKTKGGAKPAPRGKTISALAEEQRREHERQEAINSIALTAMKEHPVYLEQIQGMAEDAIESGVSLEKFELELLRNTRMTAGKFTNHTGHLKADSKVIEAAISMACGLPDIEKHYSEQTLDAVDRCGMRNNFSLQQLLMQVAHSNGYSCRAGERIGVGNLRTVLEYCFPPVHARLSGFSTIALPGILGNVANKQILAGYMEEDATWREIASVKNVSNFHQHTHYRMLDDLEYEEVGSAGQIKHGTLGQESYTSQAKTYGKMLGLTRTQIVNDDLGAFDDIRARLGRGAAKKFNNLFWATFMDNGTLFPTDKSLGNYIDGATSTLLADGVGLQLGITAFRKLKSVSADGEKRVGVTTTPSLLLVPPELEFSAEKLHISANFEGGSSTVADANIHRGRYRPVVQNRLSDTAFTGNSATAWFLFGNELKPMVVSFLNGMQTPTIESTDADFDTLGILFRGYHDFGCDQAEYLAGIKSKGAAG